MHYFTAAAFYQFRTEKIRGEQTIFSHNFMYLCKCILWRCISYGAYSVFQGGMYWVEAYRIVKVACACSVHDFRAEKPSMQRIYWANKRCSASGLIYAEDICDAATAHLLRVQEGTMAVTQSRWA